MSQQPITLASLGYIRPQELASQMTSSPGSVAVVDVRDDDYIGGHIKRGVHAPINELDARMPELLRTLKDKDRVVFHCMLSQQRGPRAALMYARAKAQQAAREGKDAEVKRANDQEGVEVEDENAVVVKKIAGQEICVLEGGFGQWQSRYGTDKNLTEGYVKELWESVFA